MALKGTHRTLSGSPQFGVVWFTRSKCLNAAQLMLRMVDSHFAFRIFGLLSAAEPSLRSVHEPSRYQYRAGLHSRLGWLMRKLGRSAWRHRCEAIAHQDEPHPHACEGRRHLRPLDGQHVGSREACGCRYCRRMNRRPHITVTRWGRRTACASSPQRIAAPSPATNPA